ncbi:alanine racemase [Helicobacter muridarum]|uniref:Alanine racemase n=1 Tax=Helicobacter muridarum TaxID=216 RepID=A0A099TVZ9_9HELI|nr:alanine racemase [Helicobacter muridarum]TLE00473.1 alanine racemase [Helicobacter muridarum]STQ86447.1 alanine racemase [Helicobacter muridarum]
MKNTFLTTSFVCAISLSLIINFSLASPILSNNKHVTKSNTNSFVEVDLVAFKKNLQITKQIAGNAKVCAVLKSDAYGASISTVLPVVMEEKIPCIAITSNEEARVIRKMKYKGEILRIRTATMGEIKDGLAYNITEVIGNLSQAKELNAMAAQMKKKLNIHINLNSAGMDRNGIDMSTQKGKDDAVSLATLPHLKITGLMAHFPYDEVSKVKELLKIFESDMQYLIKEAKLDRKKLTLHTANSYAAVQVPESRYDMIRPGKLIYGYGGGDPNLGVKQIISLKSQVATINPYPKGSKVSYDGTYTLKRDSMLANIPMGYYDGYARSFSNQGVVLIRGHRVNVVGKVAKNTFMVDVTDYPDIQAGDEVVIFGKQCNDEITQEEIQKATGTILSETLGYWGSANPHFVKDNKAKDVCY